MGGKVVILEISADQKTALLSYTAPGVAGGTSCETGDRFYLSTSELSHFEQDYQNLISAKQNIAQEIAAILKGKSSIQSSSGLSVGDELPVPGWEWVNVENSVNGGRCGIAEGGKVKILGFLADRTTALVSYTGPNNSMGTHCPSGVIFLSDSKVLANYSSMYERVIFERATLVAGIELILSGKSKQRPLGNLAVGQTIKVLSWSWQTVAVETSQSYSNRRARLAFEDVCGIEEGGTVTILGFLPGSEAALVNYSAPGDPWGTPCPNNTKLVIGLRALGR